ncbi:MAG: alanine racemase [Candidatus Izimaplasma sp.]|nr:alanine racemase [Candidatus Izimaplasma bacterium]
MNNRYRKTYAEVNLINLYQNYKNVESLLSGKKVIPVVKANAYGHGVFEVVEFLVNMNVNYFAVSLLEEALELRETFDNIDILIMGVIERNQLDIASMNNFTVTISNFDQIQNISEFKLPLKVHLMVDTGMNRLGFKLDKDILRAFNILKEHKSIVLEGIYTHFSTADSDEVYYKMQLSRFSYINKLLNYNFKMVHTSNSSSAIKYEKDIKYTTHVRLGISLYGLTLDNETNFLLNTYRLISHISEIKHLEPGDKVGYGATYTAKDKEIIGILPLGYADGFIRKNQGGDVEINNKRFTIIGRICMDQMFIKIDDTISQNDKVVLFGDLISIDEVATRLNTINYEIICQITYRVPKVYIK